MLSTSGLLLAGACATQNNEENPPGGNVGGNAGQGGTSGGGGQGASSGAGGGLSGFGGALIDGGIPLAGVPQTCAAALQAQSYIGCEYWPTVTANARLYNGFEYAVVVVNPTGSDADVTVTRGGSQLASATLKPGKVEIIKLPWVEELRGAGDGSVLAAGGAFKLESSVPVTVYQFNPLEFRLDTDPADCPELANQGGCFSFSNDASILLPKSALRGNYWVMNYPTHHIGTEPKDQPLTWTSPPGFVTITGTEDGTTVKFTARGNVRAGSGVAALAQGMSATYTLDAGDVLMLQSASPPDGPTSVAGKPCVTEKQGMTDVTLCPGGQAFDLTGSLIEADKPVSVIGGHDCTMIPYGNYACDHVEESLFPVDALGQDLIVTAPQAVGEIGVNPGAADGMMVRILSAGAANQITFDPPVNPPVTLNAGEWIEVGPVSQDFRVSGTDKLAVSQYLLGQTVSGASIAIGDPAQSVAIPVEQYRLSYSFYAPKSYTQNFINIVAKAGALITLDGKDIEASEFLPIGNTGYMVARRQGTGRAHASTGTDNFGITVYGYGSYTSYMYPGGLNLETVTVVPK